MNERPKMGRGLSGQNLCVWVLAAAKLPVGNCAAGG
jgi:hypothetical protein